MAVCQFFLRGTCKFGTQCRNEHPEPRQGGFGNQSWTAPKAPSAPDSFAFTLATITNDLTPMKEKPMWPLTSYGAAKHEPNLISGQDESPEELRVRAVTALKGGNLNEYPKYESEKIAAAEQVYTNARNNIQSVYDQAIRISQTGGANPASATSTTSTTTSAFGQPSAFGSVANPSAFGATPTSTFGGASAFGKSSFGQSAFGQSTFGQSAFGQPSSASTTGTSAFGQPQTSSAFGRPSAFGQPKTTSVFGQPAQPASAFGQPSQPTSAFGQPAAAQTQTPSAFGQPAQTQPAAPAFGQPSQPTSVFGQPSSSPATTAFGQSSFGQSSQPQSTSAFGQSSLIKPATGAFSGIGNGGGNAFSAFAGKPSTFGAGAANIAPSNPSGSVFGQSAFSSGAPVQGAAPSTFGSSNTGGTTPFGAFGQANQQPQPPQSTPPVASAPASGFGAFGQSAFGSSRSAFGNAATTSAFGQPASAPQSAFSSTPSAFGNAFSAPASTPTQVQTPAKLIPGTPNFAITQGQSPYKPGSGVNGYYDQRLPQNYISMLPQSALDAFKASKFEFGKVPEWTPPIELR